MPASRSPYQYLPPRRELLKRINLASSIKYLFLSPNNPVIYDFFTAFVFYITVLVAALGYFVDIYDLLLFSIVRSESLLSLGLDEKEVFDVGKNILMWQQAGLIIGGILWGIMGDKKGRLSVLFGSILTYSLANIACGFVQEVSHYQYLRFIAGIGLAGELGAGITLVSEILPKNLRGYGSSLVAGIGLLGAVAAYSTTEWLHSWRTSYFVGGGLGISLLLLRVSIFESSIFASVKENSMIKRGNIFQLFTNFTTLSKYLRCIGIALPIWFFIGILATFGKEIGEAMHISEKVISGKCIQYSYIGLAIGDITSGLLSQWLQSRKKAIAILMVGALVGSIAFLHSGVTTAQSLYYICLFSGFFIGYWAMFMTVTAEQFGTNIRATATTSVPNMVRGALIIMTALLGYWKESFDIVTAACFIGILCFVIAALSLWKMEETFGKELDYLEE